ncbi:MAG: GNAT family N-acetyltransferase [bacterium]|nr:GNAT family N-acetyltransferase [bacterium]
MVSFPLPLYQSVRVGGLSQDGKDFDVVAGLSENLAAELKKYSADENDTELQKNTSDKKRFVESSYEEWYSKKRFPFGLVAKNGELAGVAWFGPRPFPPLTKGAVPSVSREWETFAIRTYGVYRGKRLSYPFALPVMNFYQKEISQNPLWLSTPPDNSGALRLYEKLGFAGCGIEEDGEVVMTKLS